MIALLLYLEITRMPQWSPPKTQSAECVGSDQHERSRTLTLENRWSPSDNRMVLFVRHDSTGLLRSGNWLGNADIGYEGSDQKYGLYTTWYRFHRFSKHVGDRYVTVAIEVTGIASAKVRYVWRPYARRHQEQADITVLVGTCKLFVGNELRSLRNWPKSEPIPQ